MPPIPQVQQQRHQQRHHNADHIHGVSHQHFVFLEKHTRKEDIDGQAGTTGHKRSDQHRFVPVPLILQYTGSHDRRNRAAKAQYHGQKRPTGQPQPAHDPIHHIGNPRHISAVLQQSEGYKQHKNIG